MLKQTLLPQNHTVVLGLDQLELEHSGMEMPHSTSLTPVDRGQETATCVLWKLSPLKSPPL